MFFFKEIDNFSAPQIQKLKMSYMIETQNELHDRKCLLIIKLTFCQQAVVFFVGTNIRITWLSVTSNVTTEKKRLFSTNNISKYTQWLYFHFKYNHTEMAGEINDECLIVAILQIHLKLQMQSKVSQNWLLYLLFLQTIF